MNGGVRDNLEFSVLAQLWVLLPPAGRWNGVLTGVLNRDGDIFPDMLKDKIFDQLRVVEIVCGRLCDRLIGEDIRGYDRLGLDRADS